MKKRIRVLGLCLVMMSIMMSTVVFASSEIKVAIDGEMSFACKECFESLSK